MSEQVRDLPHDDGAERGILAAILATPDVLGDLAAVLEVTSFYRPNHQLIYQAMLDLAVRGITADPILIASHLSLNGDLLAAGGAPYLSDLEMIAAPPGAALLYAEEVRESALSRQLIEFHARGMAAARTGSGMTGTEALGNAQSGLDDIGDNKVINSVTALVDAVPKTLEGIEARSKLTGGVTGVPTGFIDLDDITSGLHPGQMIIVAGRPGSGKSTIGADFARHAAIEHKLPTLLCSLEMSTDEITMRIISALTAIPLKKIRSGDLDMSEWKKISAKSAELYDSPLFIDDSPNNTIASIRTKARRLKQRGGLKLVIIDYAQLMSSDGKYASREQEVSSISRGTKLLAKELEVPVVLMAQLNRGPEQRTDHKPQVSDLRESGSLEQDSDMVILVHREEMYDKETTRVGEADLIIGKQRNGPQGIVTLSSQLHIARFVNMGRE